MPSAAEKYGVKDSYRRFNQRMEMFCRSIWDKGFAETLRVPNYVEALLGKAVAQVCCDLRRPLRSTIAVRARLRNLS